MHYLVGDLQGCNHAFERLLALIGFSPSRDHLTVLGDLVNRGPQSLAVLRKMRALGASAEALLGNHDLHLLAVAHGVRPLHRGDTFGDVLAAPDCTAWIDWLRSQRLAHLEAGWLCVHAGVVPPWTAAQTMALAAEVEALLRGPDLGASWARARNATSTTASTIMATTNVAPRLCTSSFTAGRTSNASTTAPSRRAVAIACRPATPAPRTRTREGATVPAAVMSSGKNLPEVLAAVREALKYKAYGAAYVQSILFQRRTAKNLGEILPLTIPQKPEWNELRTKEPDLSIYDKLFELDTNGEGTDDEQPKQ